MIGYRYTQLELIGEGGFAKVYRALDNWTRLTVAIKRPKNLTPESFPRFKRERDMLTIHKNNPNVVDILDSCMNRPDPYLVLEYSSLGSLQKYVTNRRDWRRIAGWLRDISYGLTLIHERGDLVRDIKPSNLLRFTRADGSELVKIADFGLGQRSDNPWGQMTTSVFGTKGYIDPIAQATQRFSAASDIYSLGVTIKELLIGFNLPWIWTPGSAAFRSLIDSMTHSDINSRPSARQVFERVNTILQTPQAAQEFPGNGVGWVLGAAAVVTLLMLAASE